MTEPRTIDETTWNSARERNSKYVKEWDLIRAGEIVFVPTANIVSTRSIFYAASKSRGIPVSVRTFELDGEKGIAIRAK